MRIAILIGTAALALGACNRNDTANDTMTVDDNAVMADDLAMNGDIDANAMTNDSEESNLVTNDLTTNDADTNLANGM